MSRFYLQILAVEKSIYNNEAEFIKLPGWDGEIGVLADHAPLVVILKEGEIEIKNGSQVQKIPVKKGIFQFLDNRATCLIIE